MVKTMMKGDHDTDNAVVSAAVAHETQVDNRDRQMNDLQRSVLVQCELLDEPSRVVTQITSSTDKKTTSTSTADLSKKEQEGDRLQQTEEEVRRSVLLRCRVLGDSARQMSTQGLAANDKTSTTDPSQKEDALKKGDITTSGASSAAVAITKKDVPTAMTETPKDPSIGVATASDVLKDPNTTTTMPRENQKVDPTSHQNVGGGGNVEDDIAAATNMPSLSRHSLASTSLPGAFACQGIGQGSTSGSFGEFEEEVDAVSNDDLEVDIETQLSRSLPPPTSPPSRQVSTDGLTVASLVTDDSGDSVGKELPQAEPMNPRQSGKRRSNGSVVAAASALLLLMIVVVVVAVLVPILPTKNDQPELEDDIQEPLTPSPTPLTPEDYLLSHLPMSTAREVLNPQKYNSPQKQAYEWMLQDPNLINYSLPRLLQRMALATLFYSTTSKGEWFHDDHWLSLDVHECDWYNYHAHGFYEYPETEEVLLYNVTNSTAPCNEDGLYEHLWLVQNDLEGTLPEELYLLSSLKSISLDRNKLEGTLSTQIGRLTDLEALALYTNDMTGTLPSQLGRLTNLEYLWVMSNVWTGIIPTELGQLSDSLVYLLVDNNQLTGHFPSELGRLSNVLWLWLYNNQLTGSLPTEMGLMETVGSVAIDYNPFEGTIPTEVGTMTNMWTFHIDKSFINGTIPTEFSLCTNLNSLVIARSPITGTIPTEVGLMTNLGSRLWAWGTNLTGTLPTELGLLSKLGAMDFNYNSLTGTLPSELGNLESAWKVHLSGNGLTGTVPTVLGNLHNLWTFDLSNNHLSGMIPSELGAFDRKVDYWDDNTNTSVEYWNITYIKLENNSFTGPVPTTLGLLMDLQELSLYGNSNLSGSVPTSFCDSYLEEEDGLIVSVDCGLVQCNCSVCSCV